MARGKCVKARLRQAAKTLAATLWQNSALYGKEKDFTFSKALHGLFSYFCQVKLKEILG
jgi:hypothetical protein